jgi:ankyrin repeat protein
LNSIEEIDVNCRTKGGETPLMKAVQSGNIFVVGECLNNNYNPFLENSLNQTARDFAAAFNSPEDGLNIL